MDEKYLYFLIVMLFLVYSVKLENLFEIWFCFNSVNGCKFFCIWLLLELGKSCVFVKVIKLLL